MSETGNLPGNPRTTKPPWAVLGMMAVIGLLTLWPNPSQAELSAQTPFFCFPCGPSGTSDLIRNVVFFIPLGITLGVRGISTGSALGISLAVTGTVEFLQYLIVPGRDAAMADIVANTVGGGVGCLMGRHGAALLFMRPRLAAYFTVVWATLGVLGIGLMGWSLPSSSRSTSPRRTRSNRPASASNGRAPRAG